MDRFVNNYEEVKNKIINWLNDYVDGSNQKGFVIGISGGIDSAVASTLCAMTGKPVTVLEMPISQNDSEKERAKNHVKWLKDNFNNITDVEFDLTYIFNSLKYKCNFLINPTDEEKFNFSMANTRARLRMTVLYSYANYYDFLVCGTGNKVEDFGIGFFTKQGDGSVDISPIADLYKTEVRNLGKYLNINEEIISASPTDGLWDDGRTDEDQIGATYEELEWAMEFIYDNTHVEQGVEPFLEYDENLLSERQEEILSIYLERNSKNKHKMVDIPVCKF